MINIPPASFRLTPYGEVDAVALENLRDSFDTSGSTPLARTLSSKLTPS
jgi:hypothetical protein